MEPSIGADWAALGPDLTDLILSRLPIRSIVVAAAVCKMWRSVVTHPSFARRRSPPSSHTHLHHHPWFFLSAHNNVLPPSDQTFAFDPDAAQWLRIPTPPSDPSFSGAGGFFFTTTSGFSYAPAMTSLWRHTPPLNFPRCNPLVGVYSSGDGDGDGGGGGIEFIVVGGVRFFGGLVDIEDRLAVEIYDPSRGEWEVAPPLPGEFRLGNSSHWLSSAIFRRRFFVLSNFSGFVSAFDVASREWSPAVSLRPPDVLFSFLIPCRPHLVLAGLSSAPPCPSFVLWRVDDLTMECTTQIAAMPGELLHRLFEGDEDERFATLQCVGVGELVYVFNEVPHRMYPACVCDIGRRRWWMLPELPLPVNRFHKVTSFCSSVPLAPLFPTLNPYVLL